MRSCYDISITCGKHAFARAKWLRTKMHIHMITVNIHNRSMQYIHILAINYKTMLFHKSIYANVEPERSNQRGIIEPQSICYFFRVHGYFVLCRVFCWMFALNVWTNTIYSKWASYLRNRETHTHKTEKAKNPFKTVGMPNVIGFGEKLDAERRETHSTAFRVCVCVHANMVRKLFNIMFASMSAHIIDIIIGMETRLRTHLTSAVESFRLNLNAYISLSTIHVSVCVQYYERTYAFFPLHRSIFERPG